MDHYHHALNNKACCSSSSSGGAGCASYGRVDYSSMDISNINNMVFKNHQFDSSSSSLDLDDDDEIIMAGGGAHNSSTAISAGEDLRRGPWTVEEDFTLINYIARHGEGRWNSLARCAGLKRTGKSCRLRWLNYLRPDVRRGNITLEEQLLILELHSRWGNRWSKIAQHLPGRTDNEIKNYWRTRVQKHAKQLKCDVNSKQFKDTMRYLWMPRLVERIQAAAASSSTTSTSAAVPTTNNNAYHTIMNMMPPNNNNHTAAGSFTPENSSTTGGTASSDSFATQFSPVSDLTDCYNNYAAPSAAINHQQQGNSCTINVPAPPLQDYNYYQGGEPTALISPTTAYLFNQGLDLEIMDQQSNNNNNNNTWMTMMDGGDLSDNLWNNVEDAWFLQ